MACFVCFVVLARGGSPVATPELTATVVDHGHVFYVSVWQKQLYDVLLTLMMIGIRRIMITGLVLHHVVGVRMFTDRNGASFS